MFSITSAIKAILILVAFVLTATAKVNAASIDLAHLKTQARSSVIYLAATNGTSFNSVIGTAALISKQGLAVTAYHVVSGWYDLPPEEREEKPIEARLGSIQGRQLGLVTVVGVDKASDIAVLRIAGTDEAEALPICFKNSLVEEHQIYSVGFADGHELNVIPGLYTNDGRTTPNAPAEGGRCDTLNSNPCHFWEVTSAFAGGMSGGPVFDEWGTVVGLVEGGVADSQATKFVIPLVRAEPLIKLLEPIRQECRNAIEGGDPAIVPTIEMSNSGTSFPVGYRLLLNGKAFDPRTGSLSGNALTWQVDNQEARRGDYLELTNLKLGSHNVALKALVTDGRFNVTTITITMTPSTPRLQMIASSTESCGAIALDETLIAVGVPASVAGTEASAKILTLSPEKGLVEKSTLPAVGVILDFPMTLNGHSLFLRDYGGKIRQYDVSDPGRPDLAHVFDMPNGFGGTESFLVDLGQLVVKSAGSIVLFDLSDNNNPPRSPYTVPREVGEMGAGFGIDNSIIVSPHRSVDLEIFQRTPAAVPRVIGSFHDPDNQPSTNVLLSKKTAFIGSWSGVLEAISIADPQHPSIQGRVTGAGNSFRIAKWRDYVFLAGMRDGVIVVDVHDPSNMKIVGAHSTGGSVTDLAIDGDRLAVCGDKGVSLFEIADSAGH